METLTQSSISSTGSPARSQARRLITISIGFIIVLALSGGAIYFILKHNQVYIDQSLITAPIIYLSPTSTGHLKTLYVHIGEKVPAFTPVAQVGNEIIETKISGIIIGITDTIGALIPSGTPVVQMINQTQLRVVGKVDENKGLASISVGDPVTFTVDTFGTKRYAGVVDEVSQTAVSTGIVFNISSQRPTQQFDIKVRFNTSIYTKLKNGMSARMWVHTR